MDAQPVRTPVPAHTLKSKPDARPMRLALSAGAVAAISALMAAIILPPRPATTPPVVQAPPALAVDPATTPATIQVQRPIRYVQLAAGQTAPPGAKVIEAAAPTPITIVVTVAAPVQKQVAQKPIIVKTSQSGQVVP